MFISYTYTQADLREALAPEKARPDRKSRLRSFVIFVFMFLLIGNLLRLLRPPIAYVLQRPSNLMDLLIPHLIIAIAILWLAGLTYATALAQRRRSRSANRPPTFRLFGVITYVCVLGIYLLTNAFTMRSFDISWMPTRGLELLVSLLPGAAAFAILVWLLMRTARARGKIVWESRPSLHLPRVLEFDSEGLQISTDHVSHHYRWSAFARFRETPNLLVLHLRDPDVVFIPKRAMDDETLARFRALSHEFLAGPDAVGTPFPVLPLATKA